MSALSTQRLFTVLCMVLSLLPSSLRGFTLTLTSTIRSRAVLLSSTTTSTSTLKSSLSFSSSSDPDPKEGDDNLDKWQRMYDNNAPNNNKSGGGGGGGVTKNSILKSEVKVISFDLDNTLWKTSAVITGANDALADYLKEDLGLNFDGDNDDDDDDDGSVTVPRVEKVMGMLFTKNRAKYCPLQAQDIIRNNNINIDADGSVNVGGLDDDDNDAVNKMLGDAKAPPVLLTQLRIDAIREVLVLRQKLSGTITTDDDIEMTINKQAKEAFQVWTEARHDAIPSNFAASVLQCLSQIRQMKTSYGSNVVVGAITDGNSDPRKVQVLREYFDFCVNAESVGISKPDRRPYDTAVLHVHSNPQLNHVFGDLGLGGEGGQEDGNDDDGDVNRDVIFDSIGPWWVHIGDDFVKDIVAAKDLKMRSIWCRELIMEKLMKQNAAASSSTIAAAATTTTTVAPPNGEAKERDENYLDKEIAKNAVLTMTIGSEDFLLDSIQAEFADAIVDEFVSIGDVLADWHLEATTTGGSESESKSKSEFISESESRSKFNSESNPVVGDDENVQQQQQTIDSDTAANLPNPVEEVTNISPQSNEGGGASPSPSTSASKFCIMCGTNLPMEAKFCSSCGHKQG